MRRAAVVVSILAVIWAVPAIRDRTADAGARIASDFNGDGYADLAIGIPEEDIDGVKGVGAVNVLYGGATGLSTAGAQLWYESIAGTPEVNGTGDMFGFALTPGDFDGDGFGDLAVGQPFADVGGINAGQVIVLHGSESGLTSTRSQLWTQATQGVPERPEDGDRFGYTLTSGDFDGDGFADLAMGVFRESAGARNSGAVEVLYGSADALTASGAQLWAQGASGVVDTPEKGDRFGNALAAGDFDGDGLSDLAVGAEFEDVGATVDAGSVTVLRGTPGGLTGTGSQLWTQASFAGNSPEAGDGFGRVLAAGDLNGDLRADLAVGTPLEDLGTLANVGVVDVLYGSSSGLSTNGSQEWSQATQNVPDEPASGDQLGKVVAIGDLDGDGYADLAAGARYDDPGGVKDAGVVNVLYGTSTGLGTGRAQLWTQDMPDVPDAVESPDHFGSCLAAANFGDGASDDLVIGAHFETLGDKTYAGSMHVLYGSADGVRTTGSQLWTQDSPGVPEDSDAWDYFPAAFGVTASGRCG